jgi:hypothetical protein
VRAKPRERPPVIRRILAARRMLREVVAAQQTLDLSYLHSNQAASGEWLNVTLLTLVLLKAAGLYAQADDPQPFCVPSTQCLGCVLKVLGPQHCFCRLSLHGSTAAGSRTLSEAARQEEMFRFIFIHRCSTSST